jgi:hypothetical protein
MAVRFEKLYADLVTADGTVLVAYLAETLAFGTRTQHAGLEVYHPDGAREVHHARSVTRITEGDRTSLAMVFPNGTFLLEHQTEHGAWQPEGAPPCAGLDWRVCAARASARAELAGRTYVGTGYSDFVQITRAPRSLGLVELRWGRVHLSDETIVFDALTFAERQPYLRAISILPSGRRIEHAVFTVEDRDRETWLHLAGRAPIVLTSLRSLHIGHAIDRERFPSVVDRVLSRALAGRVTERRTLARVGGSFALHECVRFGAP